MKFVTLQASFIVYDSHT